MGSYNQLDGEGFRDFCRHIKRYSHSEISHLPLRDLVSCIVSIERVYAVETVGDPEFECFKPEADRLLKMFYSEVERRDRGY